MNTIIAKVAKIDSVENLNIVSFDFLGETLTMMSLDLSQEIKIGVEVELTAKATHIAIAKEFSGDISYSNQIKAKISAVNNGELLSSVKSDVKGTVLESIITLNSSKRMNLKTGDEVTIFIKASELSILNIK